MNSLALRISRSGDDKSKKSIGLSPVKIPVSFFENSDHQNEIIKNFAGAASTDEQLAILKKIVDQNINVTDTVVIKFLAVVFLEADAKHPVKCFISRCITKNTHLQETFSGVLANQISTLVSIVPAHYKQYIEVVSKVATCLENFNAGVTAVRLVEIELAIYFKDCLEFCVQLLSESKTLSPTEKNEIFNISHLALRLLLHIVQKASDDNLLKLNPLFDKIRLYIQKLVFDNDVPMDTKSVCGILYLSMHILENDPNSWIEVLNPSSSDQPFLTYMETDASQLCLYSAIATVVPLEKLQTVCLNGNLAILELMYKILEIGDRSSLESPLILGVTRTVFQMSKYLYKTADRATGQRIVESLLTFAWAHLEHHMDSVRHLTAQMLEIVVSYCGQLDREGDDTALSKLLSAVRSLDPSRKSFYVSVTCLVNVLGSRRVLDTWPGLTRDVLGALSSQHIQACATTTLEALVDKLAKVSSTEQLHEQWLRVVVEHVGRHSLDCTVLNILENLLVKAVRLDPQLLDYIIPYIKASCEHNQAKDLKCVLMLLSVTSKSGVSNKLSAPHGDEWKGVIGYDVLRQAAIDAVDETRILSLSLIVESPRSTEEFTAGDLAFVLWYLKYNINAQAPNFRQLTLSCMKKFMKRYEDSYKVIKRQKEPNCTNNKVDIYLHFLDKFRQQCFDSLLPGANYSRRRVALQLLVWCHRLHMEGYTGAWSPDHVEKLLLHLEDSYEDNKRLALEVLEGCPRDLLQWRRVPIIRFLAACSTKRSRSRDDSLIQNLNSVSEIRTPRTSYKMTIVVLEDANTYSISIGLEDIFAQASSLKPTDCASAAYKLELLRRRLPEQILQNEQCCSTAAEPVTYTLVTKLLARLQDELRICEQSVVLAARSAPMYGLLHCVTHVMANVDPGAISSDRLWTSLVNDVITVCMGVNAGVAAVVNNSSPEGHLPMDLTGVLVTDDGNSGGVVLEDGRQVSAQMVLLCAWRAVKEVSLLLGLISSRLSIAGEDSPEGNVSVAQLAHIGEHFTSLLAETKHRGAFEQAYVGFTKLLARLWRCRNPSLHSLPRSWLADLTQAIASGERKQSLCATRRSAGLPFMIQALVTTELQVQGNPTCFHSCMGTLLSVARTSVCVESRSHALNILRALFRNAALDESVAPYVGEGLLVALEGFEGDTWAERNSSTLLLSALVVRVFGVARRRGAGTPSARNTMTGRIFFLRYPRLYDYMLAKLQEVSSSENAGVVRPALYPVLLVLGRLYPSSLEGTVSNLKLASFVCHARAAGASRELRARQLAAAAVVPLVTPDAYIPHTQSTFALLRHHTKRNYCHGILLQLARLLDARPRSLGEGDLEPLHSCVEDTLWVLEQAVGDTPCYLIADEYTKVLNLIAWRFPSLMREETISRILLLLDTILFNNKTSPIDAGRDIFLSNAIYHNFILRSSDVENSCDLVIKGLQHPSYEVVLSVLKYLLILHNSLDEDMCKFQERLTTIKNTKVLDTLKRNNQYIPLLCEVLNSKYLECQQKSLKILVLEGDTQKFIIEAKIRRYLAPTEKVIGHLLECLRNEHENLTHVYLESLLNLVTKDYSLYSKVMLEIIRVVFEYSSSDNSENTRSVVVRFLERNINELLNFNSEGLSEEQKFELKATIWCTIITLLEDDEATLRQRVADAVTSQCATSRALPSACAEHIRERLERDRDSVAMFALIALLDFKSVVVTDDGNDDCRVFDQNERYNIFLEETVWTSACAYKILSHHNTSAPAVIDLVLSVVNSPMYSGAFDRLCTDNIVLFKKMVKGETVLRNDALNPKIQLFVDILRG